MSYTDAEGYVYEPSLPTYGPHHIYNSYSLLGLAVAQPFLAKKDVKNKNSGVIQVSARADFLLW
jgi:hypothetical protein